MLYYRANLYINWEKYKQFKHILNTIFSISPLLRNLFIFYTQRKKKKNLHLYGILLLLLLNHNFICLHCVG